MLSVARSWTIAGAAGTLLFALAALLFAFAPGALDAGDGPLRELGGAEAPLAAAQAFGFLGNAEVLVPVVLLTSLGLLYRERAADAGLVLGAFTAQEVLVHALKAWVARPRPEDAWIAATGWSFPSGHAARAALLAVLVVYLNRHRIAAALTVALAAAWALLSAAARVVLGVHHVTDVTAGLALGLAVGGLGVALTLASQERHQTVRVPVAAGEPPAPAPAPQAQGADPAPSARP